MIEWDAFKWQGKLEQGFWEENSVKQKIPEAAAEPQASYEDRQIEQAPG